MSKIVNSWWFNNIGIVKVHDDKTGQDKFYIGNGIGFDKQLDEEMIKAWGCKYMPDLIK